MKLLTRYWFEFDLSTEHRNRFPYVIAYGVGITAYDYQDALGLLRKWVLQTEEMPKIKKLIENVDVSILQDSHSRNKNLLPNLGCPAWRGVWHPAFNLWYGPDIRK